MCKPIVQTAAAKYSPSDSYTVGDVFIHQILVRNIQFFVSFFNLIRDFLEFLLKLLDALIGLILCEALWIISKISLKGWKWYLQYQHIAHYQCTFMLGNPKELEWGQFLSCLENNTAINYWFKLSNHLTTNLPPTINSFHVQRRSQHNLYTILVPRPTCGTWKWAW